MTTSAEVGRVDQPVRKGTPLSLGSPYLAVELTLESWGPSNAGVGKKMARGIDVTGGKGSLTQGYIVSSWWALKQFTPTLPSESMVGTF